ncbi:thiamine monophosphate synthase/TENI-domain-containing protein [Lactarius psammicola]|nr:thiamine monophosphate synthase/TENI-domain-containing protein [Lactarius psammicola]
MAEPVPSTTPQILSLGHPTRPELLRGGPSSIAPIKNPTHGMPRLFEAESQPYKSAKKSGHCLGYNVPVIINDRVDVALASGAAGVHLGQTDMPFDIARKLLAPSAIIGVLCTTPEHACKTARTTSVSAQYTRERAGTRVWHRGCVRHAQRARRNHQGRRDMVYSHRLLLFLFFHRSVRHKALTHGLCRRHKVDELALHAARLRISHWPRPRRGPNVKTQPTTVTLALSGSPIMAEAEAEQANFARMPEGLLTNFGTIDALDGMFPAGSNANQNGNSRGRQRDWFPPHDRCHRRQSGNAAEIGARADSNEACLHEGPMRRQPQRLRKCLRCRCIALLSDPTDHLSDDSTVIRMSNGHELLGQITGARKVRGPGTFLPALMDELGVLTPETGLRIAKIEVELE